MQTQNLNLYQKNKQLLPQIFIYQLPDPQPLKRASLFFRQAEKPLNADFKCLKKNFIEKQQNKPESKRSQFNSHPNKQFLSNHSFSFQSLIRQNQELRKKSEEAQRLYEQQKQKFNELKNHYKEGEFMFSKMETAKIDLQIQNRQLRIILQKFYKQLNQSNQATQNSKNTFQNFNDKKIKKVKIGNKKIPVITVNVPPQALMKNQNKIQTCHFNSSINRFYRTSQSLKNPQQKFKPQSIEISNHAENQSQINPQQFLLLSNRTVQPQINRSQGSIDSFQDLQDNSPLINKSNCQLQSSFGPSRLKFSHKQNQILQSNISENITSQQSERQNSISYYKSKYDILQTELEKKDQALKDLYNQCFMLQSQIDHFKKSSALENSEKKSIQHQQNKNIFRAFSASKLSSSQNIRILDLEKQVNQLNRICQSNTNNTSKIDQLNDTISKLLQQNAVYKQRNELQETEIKRLYTILQNKNTELTQIYTVINEQKKNSQIDVKPGHLIKESINFTPKKFEDEKQSTRKTTIKQHNSVNYAIIQ